MATIWARMRKAAESGALVFLLAGMMLPGLAWAADAKWRVDPNASRLFFQSIKNNAVVETSTFHAFSGEIEASGAAQFVIELDSIDTGIDLRNVRMRFLFFETFKFQQAIVTANVDPSILADLVAKGRVIIPLDLTIDLHGVQHKLTIDAVVTRIADNRVAVASAEPILIMAELFGLDEGVLKLEDAAKVDILPGGSVSFDLVFEQVDGASLAQAPPAATTAARVSTAKEPTGDFSFEACIGRFEILSRTGSIYFESGSARLAPSSAPLLETVIAIVERCPSLDITVEGHTDSIGAADLNQRLSEARAQSVADYLIAHGVDESRISAIGYGELVPIAPNDTARNRSRNRRIKFTADTR